MQMLHVFANDLSRALRPLPRMELAEVEGLCGGYQLDAKHAVCVIEDLGVLQRRVQPRGHEIFPVHSTGRDEV